MLKVFLRVLRVLRSTSYFFPSSLGLPRRPPAGRRRFLTRPYGMRFFNPGAPETGPKYAIRRPAVIAPVQKINDATANSFAPLVAVLRSSDGFPNTRRRRRIMLITANATNTILM